MGKIIDDLKIETLGEVRIDEKYTTYFERELSLMKKSAIEKTMSVFFEAKEETVKKIIEVYTENLIKIARSGNNKENEALIYLENLFSQGKIEEATLNKFKEFEKYRRTVKKKPFNTKRMVNLILNQFKITTEEHLRATIDLTIDKNWQSPDVNMIPFKKFVVKKEVEYKKVEW